MPYQSGTSTVRFQHEVGIQLQFPGEALHPPVENVGGHQHQLLVRGEHRRGGEGAHVLEQVLGYLLPIGKPLRHPTPHQVQVRKRFQPAGI